MYVMNGFGVRVWLISDGLLLSWVLVMMLML